MQAGGVDAGALQHLPGGFQDEALLRVHGERLARLDAEERGVEVGGLVQEAALADVHRAGVLRVGVVQRGQVPAPVLGERGDAVPARADQVPEVLGGGDAAGETAGHGDDRQRLVRRGGSRGATTGPRGDGSAEERVQVAGDGVGGGVVEGQGGGQAQSRRGGQAVAEPDGGGGGEAERLEGPAGVDGTGVVQTGGARRLGPDQVLEGAQPVGVREGGEETPEGGRGRLRHRLLPAVRLPAAGQGGPRHEHPHDDDREVAGQEAGAAHPPMVRHLPRARKSPLSRRARPRRSRRPGRRWRRSRP